MQNLAYKYEAFWGTLTDDWFTSGGIEKPSQTPMAKTVIGLELGGN